MLTRAAVRTVQFEELCDDVSSRAELYRAGCTRDELRARLAARRWQRIGKAIALHNRELDRHQRWRAALINCGPRAVLASFTAAELLGLRGWERDAIHVLAPAGVARLDVPQLRIVLHRARSTAQDTVLSARRCQRLEHAVVLAASAARSPRPGCGIVAAAVQQRLTTAPILRAALLRAPRARHHRVLLLAVDDIEMGAHALSEIDFAALCRRHRLPTPSRQSVREQRDGKRRYLDVEWELADGRRVVAEVDGALHTAAQTWFDDQLRQNVVTLGGAMVLRFPSFIVRTEPELVVAQLSEALGARR